MKNALIGFGICYIVMITAACIAMYQGYLIDKTKLQVTVCAAVADAVATYQEDMALPNAVDEKLNGAK